MPLWRKLKSFWQDYSTFIALLIQAIIGLMIVAWIISNHWVSLTVGILILIFVGAFFIFVLVHGWRG